MKKSLADHAQTTSPFADTPDHELPTAVVMVFLSMPTKRLQALVETKSRSAKVKDRYEARELAAILFVQQELRGLPATVPDGDVPGILKETLMEMFENISKGGPPRG